MSQVVALNQWSDLTFALPGGTGSGPLRIDPSDCVSVIEIKRIALTDQASGDELFSASTAEHLKHFQFSECAALIRDGDVCIIFSCSSDSYFVLPGTWRSDRAAHLEVTILVQTSLSAGAAAFQASQRGLTAEIKEALEAAELRSNEEIGRLRQALHEAERRNSEAGAEAERLENLLAANTVRMRQEMQREVRMLQELLDSAEDRAAEDRAKEDARKLDSLAVIEKELASTRAALETERALLLSERTMRAKMLNSKSWVFTKPLRGFMKIFHGRD